MSDVERRALQWLLESGDTGASSEAICAHMLGLRARWGMPPPMDPGDFGRCARLLRRFPEWRGRLPEMAQHGGRWHRLVAHWPQVTEAMEREVGIDWDKGRSAPETYRLMEKIMNEPGTDGPSGGETGAG